jgi:hypothetical protein
MNKIFFKKEEISVRELLQRFQRTKKVADCRNIHDHCCFIYGIVHGIKGVLNFKKFYILFFILSIIRNFKKYNTVTKFLTNYFKFFKNPLLYVFTFNFIGKYGFCLIKNYTSLNNFFPNVITCFLSGLSIFFETDKRSEGLATYIFAPTMMTVVHHAVDKNFEEYAKKKKIMKLINVK